METVKTTWPTKADKERIIKRDRVCIYCGKKMRNGKDVPRTDWATVEHLNHLGYIFQDYALVPELSAEENVTLPLMMMGYAEKKAIEIAGKTLDRLGLEGKHANRPSQLSGGQQQRVSIARAVAKDPELLFADEPTANLDSESSDDVIDALRKLHSEGQTILMVTHEHEYTQFCNRVLWMEDGVITKELEPYKKS